MTIKDLLLRWFLLAVMLVSLLIIYVMTDRAALAEKFAPPYIASTQAEARASAYARCNSDWFRSRRENCAELSQSEVDSVIAGRRHDYEREHIDPLLKYGENAAIAVCFSFALAALWNFWRWARSHQLPRLIGMRRVLRRLPDFVYISKRLEARRLHKANAEFLTLKNLFENGLLSEEDFRARKSSLTTSLVSTPPRK